MPLLLTVAPVASQLTCQTNTVYALLMSEKQTCKPHTRILVSRKLAPRRRYDLRPEVLIQPANGHTSQRAQGPKSKAIE